MRFGLLLNGRYLQQWQYQVVKLLMLDGHTLVVAVVRHEEASTSSALQKIRHYPYNHLLYRLWQRFFFRPKAKKTLDISVLLNEVPVLTCKPIRQGFKEWIPEEVGEQVAAYGPDFLMRFGFNIISGSLLDVPKYGIWSFHHDDEELIRGGPPGFWEVMFGHEVNGVVLQRLTPKLDAGLIIDKIWLPVIKHSYKAHLDMLLRESAFMPVKACRFIALNGWSTTMPLKKGKLYRNPGNIWMLKFLMSMPFRRLSFHLKHFFRHESWAVGIVRMPLEEVVRSSALVHAKVEWKIHPCRAQYVADPFVVEFQDETILLAEHFDYRRGSGRLVRLFPGESYSQLAVETPDDYHRSFPFLFEYRQKLYCLPECFASQKITLFEYDHKNNRLHSPIELLTNVQALDPILFEHQGFWWLMYSEKKLPGVQLYAWFADQPFGPFHPHPLNPLKTDPRSVRNAGTPFLLEGNLIRPAQDVAGVYGKAVTLQRVHTLTPQHFQETTIARLTPQRRWPLRHGWHTFNAHAQFCVLDAKTYRFSLAGFRHVWKLKIKAHRK